MYYSYLQIFHAVWLVVPGGRGWQLTPHSGHEECGGKERDGSDRGFNKINDHLNPTQTTSDSVGVALFSGETVACSEFPSRFLCARQPPCACEWRQKTRGGQFVLLLHSVCIYMPICANCSEDHTQHTACNIPRKPYSISGIPSRAPVLPVYLVSPRGRNDRESCWYCGHLQLAWACPSQLIDSYYCPNVLFFWQRV